MLVKRMVVTVASSMLIAATFFAPLPPNIALNHETKQCAGYWGGDEFVTFDLPAGWKAFEFQYSEDFISAETDIDTCKVATNGDDRNIEEACCSQLSYTFVSDNIGIRKVTSSNLTSQAVFEEFDNQNEEVSFVVYYIFLFIIILALVLVVLLIRQNRRE